MISFIQNEDAEPDVLAMFMRELLALAPGFSAAVLELARQNVVDQVGGQRVRIPKRGKFLTPEQRQAVYADGLTDMPTQDITAKHKISRATLYREMKRGGGRFS